MLTHSSGSLRISVIIPALNEEKLIQQTLSQFTPEVKERFGIEVIVSDGGSTDNTLFISTKLSDKVVENTSGIRQTISQGRNEGVKAADGELLFLFNADTKIVDIYKFFEVTTKAFNDASVLAATCPVKVFPEEEKLSDRLFHGCYNCYVRLLNFIGMGMGRGECHLIRESIFLESGGYNESLTAGEDYDLFKRIKKYGKIKFFNQLLVYESPRRYRKYGYRKVFWEWTKNSFSVFFRNRSISKEWEAVR